jgi:hypothetical protein
MDGGDVPIKYHPQARLLDENMVHIPSSPSVLAQPDAGPSFHKVEPVDLLYAARGATCYTFICGLLNDALSIPDYTASNSKLISELKSI